MLIYSDGYAIRKRTYYESIALVRSNVSDIDGNLVIVEGETLPKKDGEYTKGYFIAQEIEVTSWSNEKFFMYSCCRFFREYKHAVEFFETTIEELRSRGATS